MPSSSIRRSTIGSERSSHRYEKESRGPIPRLSFFPAPSPVAELQGARSREGRGRSRPELSRRASNEFGARVPAPGTDSGWRRWGPRTQRSARCARARAGCNQRQDPRIGCRPTSRGAFFCARRAAAPPAAFSAPSSARSPSRPSTVPRRGARPPRAPSPPGRFRGSALS
jgi:hypothetical protein